MTYLSAAMLLGQHAMVEGEDAVRVEMYELNFGSVNDILSLQPQVAGLILIHLLRSLLLQVLYRLDRGGLIASLKELLLLYSQVLEVVLLGVHHFKHAFLKDQLRVLGMDTPRFLRS